MSQGDQKTPEKKHIAEAVSQFASSNPIPQKDDGKYQEEKRFTELVGKKENYAELVGPKENSGLWRWAANLFKQKDDNWGHITPRDFLNIEYGDARQNLRERQDAHSFRKWFLVALFVLICIWLAVVVYFVNQNAMCPTVDDRGKLIQIQSQIVSMALDKSNAVDDAMLTVASPKFNENYFHLSDSVLIAFITSTTVAVLGLFLTAANWLFNNRSAKKPSPKSKKSHSESEEDENG